MKNFIVWLDRLFSRKVTLISPQLTINPPQVTQNLPAQPPMSQQTQNGTRLYEAAAIVFRSGARVIANNASDGYGVFGCAETVNAIATKAWGRPIGGGLSTALMWEALKDTTKYQLVDTEIEPCLPGDIIISPTGSGAGAKLKNGHVGIVARYGILSNSSETGHLAENYDLEAWRRYFSVYGGLLTLVYRPL